MLDGGWWGWDRRVRLGGGLSKSDGVALVGAARYRPGESVAVLTFVSLVMELRGFWEEGMTLVLVFCW